MGKYIAVVAVFFAIFCFVGAKDSAEAAYKHSQYCEMVRLWNMGKQLGIPPEDRAGWPPFDGDCGTDKVRIAVTH